MLGYFGPEGTFTHQALLTLNLSDDAKPYASVGLTLDAVRCGEVKAGLVPIENSIEGQVSATIDNLAADGALMIVAEVLLPVRFGLYVRPGTTLEDVRTIITHPHAAAQVRDWLAVNVPKASVTQQGSTAAAAAEVAHDDSPYDAAVCAAVAGDMYGLVAVASDIADNPDAVTRFVLVSQASAPGEPTGHDKTSIIVHIHEDRPGALLETLEQFSLRGVNLCRIESRPEKDRMGNYFFSVDAEGHVREARIQEALMGLHRTSRDVTFLGSYPRADHVEPSIREGATDQDFVEANEWLTRILGE